MLDKATSRQSRVIAPPLSCDTATHIFGPVKDYPVLPPPRVYDPIEEDDIEMLRRLHKEIGIDRAVLVQASIYGSDHRLLMEALDRYQADYRGIAVADTGTTGDDIRLWNDHGIRGVRFNFVKFLKVYQTVDEANRIIRLMAPHGWHALFHMKGQQLVEYYDFLSQLDIPFVIDHLGHLDLAAGTNQEPFEKLSRLQERENCWVKISNADRWSAHTAPYPDTLPVIAAVAANAPDRVMWGTDWPHLKYKDPANPGDPIPPMGDLLGMLFDAVPDEQLRRRILIDNPARLYGFDKR